MSDNKFIKRLKGEQTAKSVLEIKNESAKTSFANMPQGTSNAINVYSDHRGNATAVLEGTHIWKLNNSQFAMVPNAFGDGRDFTSTYTVFGSSLWVNATYTFDQPKIFTGSTQWTLKLCGHSLLSSLSNTIGFSLIIKFGNAVTITKSFSVSESAFEFCKEFIIDFSESEQTAIKVANGDTMTVQLLCADATASATIYNGMTTLVAQQRRVDGGAVASDLHTFEDLEVEIAQIQDDIVQIHEDIDDLEEYVDNTFVRLDGESIMTGPLKMRATSSFQCAIAPFWDGVGFYKLNSDNSVTLIASIETPDGFVPWVTNTYNIGSSLKKWKNLYLAGKAYMSVVNNGYDIAVPVTNSADTLALKSQVDLAANSGRMITDQGVWYAKMYAATMAPAAEDGTNYADFSQVDGQGNPIIVIYSRVNGAWVQDQTITPPAEYDGYVPITSKIWDITEQAGQQGGRILWNHQSKEFTPYPQIISFEDIEITGNSTVVMPQNPTGGAIVNKDYVDNAIGNGTITFIQGGTTVGSFTTNQSTDATIDIYAANTDLSNLTDTGANIANWSSNISNCITEIPQDINIELSSGSLIVKAGSKAYMPDGTTVTVASDITVTASSTTDRFLFLNNTGTAVDYIGTSYCYSGATAPTVSGTARWFDTANNVFKQTTDSGSTWTTLSETLPIAIFHTTSGSIDKVEVFNGFGYFGSSIFALPGVKILIPQGRNADGTLKNKAHTVPSIRYYTYTGTATFSNYAFVVSETGLTTYTVAYNPETNYVYRTDTGATYTDRMIAGNVNIESGRITYFKTKQAFHATDYSDSITQIQNVDSSRVGYIYTVQQSNVNIYAPAGGTWLVLASYAIDINNGTVYINETYIKKLAGAFVAGGTQIQAAHSRKQVCSLLKVA